MLVLGSPSSGLRSGLRDSTRYSLYSIARTIEAALGTDPLTRNDALAVPFNDMFAAQPKQ